MDDKKKKVREPHELAERCWELVDEAITSSEMTLENGTMIKLNPDSYIRLVQWLATSKAKKPQHVIPPEDFILKKTGEDGEKEN